MKHIILAILGSFFAWSVIAFLTESWAVKDFVVAGFLGFVVGFAIKKQTEKNDSQDY